MPTKYFRLVATDNCPAFEPVSQWMGVWSGIAKVEDDAEIERLTKRGCAEITEEAYLEEQKKKPDQRNSWQDFRQVESVLARAAQPVVPGAPQTASHPVPAVSLGQITADAPLPPQASGEKTQPVATAPTPTPERRKSAPVN